MINNILIFRTDRIGDLLVSCPAIITIKKKVIILGIFKNEIEAHETYMIEFNKLMEGVKLG